jgi:hypothetical protein
VNEIKNAVKTWMAEVIPTTNGVPCAQFVAYAAFFKQSIEGLEIMTDGIYNAAAKAKVLEICRQIMAASPV